MLDADRPAFAAALNELAVLKPGAPKLTAVHLDAWWNAMRDKWSLDAFRQACAKLRDGVEFMPNPFHFEQLRKSLMRTCGEAWSQALEHAKTLSVSGGFLQERESGDELLDRAAHAIGGFKAIASAGGRDLQFLEKRFCEHYEDIATSVDARLALPQVVATAVIGSARSVVDEIADARRIARPQ